MLVLRLHGDAQHGRANHPLPRGRKTQRLDGIDQAVAPMLLVLVAGQFGTALELRQVLLPRSKRREEILLPLTEQAEHPLRHLGGQDLVRVLVLHAPVHLVGVEIDTPS